MHQAGLIRAIASSLDCLAGVIIGVAALPHSILKADFKQARAALARIDDAASPGRVRKRTSPRGWRAPLPPRVRRAGSTGRSICVTCSSIAAAASNWGSISRSRRFCLARTASPHPARAAYHTFPATRAVGYRGFIDTPWNMVLDEEGARTLGLMNSTVLVLEAAQGNCSISGGGGALIPAIFASPQINGRTGHRNSRQASADTHPVRCLSNPAWG